MTPSLAVASQALITLIYEAATQHGAWSQFLAALAQQLQSHAGLIWANDFSNRSVDVQLPGSGLAATYGFASDAMASFASYYGARNVWLEDASLHREGAVVTRYAPTTKPEDLGGDIEKVLANGV